MKTVRLAAILLILSVASLAQGIRYANNVVQANGRPYGGATIRVCIEPASGTPCTPLAAIYSDKAGQDPLPNPFTADGAGNFAFYVKDPATVHVQVSGTHIQTYDIPDINLGQWPTANVKNFEQVRYADQYGASPSNSAATNTAALQAWLNSGGTRLYLPDGVYTTNELTLPSNVEIFGPGTLKQAVAGFEVFYCAGCSNVWIHGITLQGVGGNGVSPAPTNDDCGVKVANPSTSASVANIRIDHVKFTGWLLYGAWLQNAKDVWFDHNYFYSSGPIVRLEGVTEAHVTDNIARDTSIDPSLFKSAISLPGTTGGYATDQHVIIAHNTIANYSNTQAVLIHSCTDCTVADNHLIGVNQGVGAAPAATTDTVVRLQVDRNTYESTSTVGGSTGNQCIFVAGNSTASADHPVISGNSCYNANLVDQNTGEGAIGLSYTDGAIVEGNSLNHSYVSGIYLNNVNTNLHIGSNLIANGQVVGGLNEGVYIPSGQGAGTTGAITHNTFTAYLDGLRFDTSATGLVVGENTFAAVTGAKIVSPSNVTVATTSFGTVNAQLQSDAYPSVVLDGPNRELCIGAGSVPCDVTMSRGAGGTASFNVQVNAPWIASKNIEQVRYADQFSGADIGAKINAAIADLPAAGGIVVIPTGTYAISTQVLVQKPVLLEGQGQGAVLRPTIANAIVLENGSAVPYLNGGLKNIIIDGTNAPAGAVGVEQIDSIGMLYENVGVENFSGAGSECLLLVNETEPTGEPGTATFNERTTFSHVHTYNCATGLEFRKAAGGAASFEYTHLFDFHADVLSGGQVGMLVSGGAYLQHSHVEPFFNITSASGTETAVELNGGSQISQSFFVLMAEASVPSNAVGLSVCSTCTFDVAGYEDTFGIADSVASGATYSWTSQATKVLNPLAPSGTNVTGQGLTISAQPSTGSAQGGSIVFQSSAGGASGSTANSLATAFSTAFGTDNRPSLFIGGNPSASGIAQIEYGPAWVVGGVTADILGIADSGTKQLVGIDHSGNLGLAADLYAPAVVIGGGSTLSTSNQTGTGSIVMSSGPSIASPTLTGTTNAVTLNAATFQQGGVTGSLAFSGNVTTTAAASDPVTVTGATAASHCVATPTNATAATLTGVYLSGKAANQVTLNHSATAGATFDVVCTAN